MPRVMIYLFLMVMIFAPLGAFAEWIPPFPGRNSVIICLGAIPILWVILYLQGRIDWAWGLFTLLIVMAFVDELLRAFFPGLGEFWPNVLSFAAANLSFLVVERWQQLRKKAGKQAETVP